MTVVGHDVILHPCGGLQLLPTVLAGKRLLDITKITNTNGFIHQIKWRGSQQTTDLLTSDCDSLQGLDAPHLSAVLHVFLQTFNRLPAHTFALWAADSALGHDLEVPTLLLTSWRGKNKTAFSLTEITYSHFCCME